eukprot:2286303-Pyramimonas_sp.AAC.1
MPINRSKSLGNDLDSNLSDYAIQTNIILHPENISDTSLALWKISLDARQKTKDYRQSLEKLRSKFLLAPQKSPKHKTDEENSGCHPSVSTAHFGITRYASAFLKVALMILIATFIFPFSNNTPAGPVSVEFQGKLANTNPTEASGEADASNATRARST